jgi:cell wall-associated NlpC family hydrolase/uncharacterized protein YgiM (DUF1202 family)
MRKPLAALSLAFGASLGAPTVAQVLAAQTASTHLNSSPTNSSKNSSTVTPAVRSTNTVSGAAIVRKGLQYIGYPYTAVGNSPSTGFSCIGFASFVYRSLGIPLPGDLQDALNYAPQVPFSQLQPGDLLFFQNTLWNGLSHVAIYIGGGRFVHAEYYGAGVRVSSFNNDARDSNYWISKYMTANRPWSGASVSPVITTPPIKSPVKNPVVSSGNGGPHSAVTVPSLNVRSGPGKTNSIVTVVAQGTDVTILSKQNGWYHVQLPNGTTGWVVAYGIGLGNVAPNPSTASTSLPTQPARQGFPTAAVHHNAGAALHHPTTTVRATGLRLHSSPSLQGSVQTTLPQGQRLTVLSRSGTWIEVRTANGQVGWVDAAYTSSTKSVRSTYNKVATRSSAGVSVQRISLPKTTSRVSGLRVHTAPSRSAGVVTTLAQGQRVSVISRSDGWTQVRTSSGQVGWIYAAYTTASVSSANRTSVATRTANRTATTRISSRRPVLTAGVRVHAAPGLSARVVTLAAAGTHVAILGRSGAWALVRLPSGRTGYVYALYLRG